MNWGNATDKSLGRRVIRAIRTIIVCGYMACWANPGEAAEKVTVTASANAIVVTPLSFFKVDDLSFGRLVAGTTAGTVAVAPDGTRTATGGVRLASGGNTAKPARFAGQGAYNQTVAISVNATSNTMTRVGGTETMTFDTFVIGSSPTTTLTTAPLSFYIGNTTGQFNFPVGATLRVKANQAPGTYTGTFSITLQYY